MAMISLTDLALCVVVLTIGSYIHLEMWLISLAFALLLLVAFVMIDLYRKKRGELIHKGQYVNLKDVFNGLPYTVIPFLLSMFIAVLALDRHAITHMFSDRLFSITDSSISVGLLFGFASALSSN
ncbi:MAG TPA: hypothetical protein DDZ89_05260, partial [Clostridiales bacterium]|nr:hypothetical protein [Clostridiales bacterium]